ncbi:reverse transcriptase domain-containing protein [Tanacetum coccineum]
MSNIRLEENPFSGNPKPKPQETVNVEIQDLNSSRPNSYQSKLPYPERMKVRENDKPTRCYVEQREQIEESAIITVNAECSAIIMNKVPKKLEDPGKFLILCALQELDRTSALADFGASVNLLPHSIYKQLGLEALTPTRMTLELANQSDPFSGSTTNILPPSSSPMKTGDNFEKFADELALLDSLPPGWYMMYFDSYEGLLREDNFSSLTQILYFEFDGYFQSSNVNLSLKRTIRIVDIMYVFFPSIITEEKVIEAYIGSDSFPPEFDIPSLPP